MTTYNVNVIWDAEARVWIAFSDDIGMTLESKSMDKLQAEIPEAINGLLDVTEPGRHHEFVVDIHVSGHEVYTWPMLKHKKRIRKAVTHE